MGRQSSIDGLPEDVRRWLERALADSNFSGYQALEEMLHDRGYAISKSAIHRYGQKIERRFAAIKASTEAARMLTEGAADDQDARSEAVIALVQTELFDSLINLQDASDEKLTPAERIGLLSDAAKNIATLARASVNQKKFRLELQARAQAAADAVEKVVKTGGLSDDAANVIRKQILGIVA
ncbi:DUF3486 family protein [Jeongeupia wiesaeckerbachi]|uniref:DUF3486 family protein n=1 Tax=Jeongeupia wiesaeckerbachi TaxID=3051218 RepID=UPI003D807DFF